MYNLFISHSWKYDDDYQELVKLLDSSGISYKNYSVPKADPLDANNAQKLKEAIERQINPASCLIAVAGVYVSHSDLIGYEIQLAKQKGKKIIGVRPLGQEWISSVVIDNADEIVYWRSSSIADAIKNQCNK